MTDYVIADIHGNYDGFKELIDTVKYSNKDTLIILGDIVDGGYQSKQAIEFAVNLQNITFIIGNHDLWFLNWAKGGPELPIWTTQGGMNTLYSYDYDRNNVPESHIKLLDNAPYYLIKNNDIFVHGGFNPKIHIDHNKRDFIIWDRDLIKYAQQHPIAPYNRVFVGHTSTKFYGSHVPIKANNLIMCDTGGGWMGNLSLIDINTLNFWQADGVKKREF